MGGHAEAGEVIVSPVLYGNLYVYAIHLMLWRREGFSPSCRNESDVCTELEYTKKEINEKWYVAIASTAMKNIVTMYENLDTKMNKTTKDMESLSGRIYCSNEVDRTKAYFDGYDMTMQDCIDMANERLRSFFPEYELDLDLMWVKIISNTRPATIVI